LIVAEAEQRKNALVISLTEEIARLYNQIAAIKLVAQLFFVYFPSTVLAV